MLGADGALLRGLQLRRSASAESGERKAENPEKVRLSKLALKPGFLI